jgi:hypothetical protein
MRFRLCVLLGLLPLLAAPLEGGAASPSPEDPAGKDHGSAAAPFGILGGGGAFLLAWESRSGAGAEPDIFFNRREPGERGAWLDEPRRLDTDEPGAARSLEPRLAAGPGELVFAVWQDPRTGKDDIRFNRSTDGGFTWLREDVRVNTGRAGEAAASMPAIAADGRGRVYVAWEDRRDGYRDIRFNRSTDAGLTWWPEDRRLDSDGAGSGISYHPQIVAWEDGTVLVCWWDERDGLAELYVRRSTDAGETWPEAEVRLDPGKAGEAASHGARLAVAGDDAAVVWEEIRGTQKAAILLSVSRDRGASWRNGLEQCPEAQGRDPRVWIGPDGVGAVAWVSHLPGGALMGSRFRAAEAAAPSAPCEIAMFTSAAGAPWLGGAGGVLWLAWVQERGKGAREGEIGFLGIAESRDGGGSWRLRTPAGESRTRADDLPGPRAHSLTGAVTANGVLHLAWIREEGTRSRVRSLRLEPAEESAGDADEGADQPEADQSDQADQERNTEP